MRLINPTPDSVYFPDLGFEFGPGEEHDLDLPEHVEHPPVPLEKATADARKRAKRIRNGEEHAEQAADTAEEAQ